MLTAWRFSRCIGCCALVAALFATTPSHAVIGTFTGGDPGDGLDFSGTFTYAVNVFGPGGFSIGDANFVSDNPAPPGYTQNAGASIINWAAPNFGATTNDNNLEVVMQSIRHFGGAGNYITTLSNLTVGQDYKVQLLFTESCCNRGFDIYQNGTLVHNDFNIPTTQGGINGAPTNGAVVTHSFTALGTTAQFRFDGINGGAPDQNPTLSGLTLEQEATTNSFAGNIAFGKPVTATSTYPNALFVASKAVDGTGVSSDAQGFQWLAADGVQSASLTIDLQGEYNISSFELLNTGNAGFLDRATGNFSIDVAGADGIFEEAVATTALQPFTSGFQTELVDLDFIQFVRFNMESIADPAGGIVGATGGGLNEIQVIGTLAEVPEPTSIAIWTLIGTALVVAARRRWKR